MTNRRTFLRQASLATAAALAPRTIFGQGVPAGWRQLAPGTSSAGADSDLNVLAHRALDAATAAGAQYADVRFTLTRVQSVSFIVEDYEHMAVGVRALVNGAWGFVGSATWSAEEVARLGTQASQQAGYNKWKPGPGVDIGVPPAPAVGQWSTPVQRDTFTVPVEEKMDFVQALSEYAAQKPNSSLLMSLQFQRQECTFASTEGAFCTQTLHSCFGGYSTIDVSITDFAKGRSGRRSVDFFGPTGGGYELVSDGKFYDVVDQLYDDADRMQYAVPVEIGKFDVVFDGYAMAALVGQTIGEATELDRVRGYEANAGGTSYLAPATSMVGQRQLGLPTFTVHADRTSPHGAASVHWDAEGVRPTAFDIVNNGMLVDYATTREHAGTLAAWYRSSGRSSASRGCSSIETAMNVPLVGTPNLSVEPAPAPVTFDDLVASTQNGYAVIGGSWNMDHQKLNGQGRGAMVYRIRNGRLRSCISGAGVLIRAPELWKSLNALGGAASVRSKGFTAHKGQPDQEYSYSVSSPAGKFNGLSVIDLRRKR